MNLLIVGGTGVLSTAVVREALDKGMKVSVINRGHKKGCIPDGVELIQSDIKDSQFIKSALEGRHFNAAIDFLCYNKEQITYSLELFKDLVDQYVFISTACVYDTSIPGVKTEDSAKGLKEWNYSTDKWACEQYLVQKAAEEGINYSIVRPCVTYDDTRIPYGIMPPYGYHWTLVARILAGKPVITWNGGSARWNIMRVEDLAVGVVGLVGNEKAYGQAFNICGDDPVSWAEVLDKLGKILGKAPVCLDITSAQFKKYCPGREGEISGRAYDAIIDNSKIKDVVPEFKQKISLEDGLAKTVEAYRSQNYQKGIDWRFDALWDYIVMKEQSRRDHLNMRFINYIGTASLKDRFVYLLKKYNLKNL